MNRKLYIIMLCIIMISTNIVYGANEENGSISSELGSPQYLTLEVVENKFLIGWKNPIDIFSKGIMDYQVDFKLGRGQWISTDTELTSRRLTNNLEGKSSIVFDPVAEGVITEDIDLANNSYSFRIRYRQSYINNVVNQDTYGLFSSPVILGLQPYYQNASKWAFEELDKAVEYNIISDRIREDMKEYITREEFSEVVVKLYELQTGETINYEGQFFNDTINPEVLKAAKLGIVKGVGKGQFAPNNLVTRQEIAVMLKRTLALLHPNMDFTYENNIAPTTESNIAEWAIHEVNFMREQGILKGDDKGLINPIGHTTREQAVILTLRTHEKFK